MKKTFSIISVVTLLINLIMIISVIINGDFTFLMSNFFKVMIMTSFYSILCLCCANIIEKRNAYVFSIIGIIIILLCFAVELINMFGFVNVWPNIFSLEIMLKISSTTAILPLAIASISLILSITNNSKVVNLFVFMSSVATSMFFLILFLYVWKNNQITGITDFLISDNYKVVLIFLSLSVFSSSIMIILNNYIKNTDITDIIQDKDPFIVSNYNPQTIKEETTDIKENNMIKSELIDTPTFEPIINNNVEDSQFQDIN